MSWYMLLEIEKAKKMGDMHFICSQEQGGGILGDLLLRREIVGAIEIESYPREVLLQRQADGMLPRFPIWDDVSTFRLDNPETREYIEWLISIRDRLTIAGGFPCQDLSVCGKGAGLDGARSGLWSEMLRIIGEIRPRHIFVENSPALLVRGFDRVLSGLSEVGYDCRWGIIGADDVGAPHQRKRFWLCGNRGGCRWPTPIAHDRMKAVNPECLIRKDGKTRMDALNNLVVYSGTKNMWGTPECYEDGDDAYIDEYMQVGTPRAYTFPTPGASGLSNGSGNCEKANRLAEQGAISEEERRSFRAGNGGQLSPDWTEWLMGWPAGWTSLNPMDTKAFELWKSEAYTGSLWDKDPADIGKLPRVVRDCPDRADRLKAIGNGQVPSCVAVATGILGQGVTA